MERKVREIIAKSNLDPHLRKALQESFSALVERQQSFETSLGQLLKEELGRYEAPEIISGLIPRSKLRDYSAQGLFAVAETGKRLLYLRVPYERMVALCEKEYQGSLKGSQVSYRLVPWFGNIDAERDLNRLWQLYGFGGLPPFLPWARRCVCIDADAAESFELCLSENGLADIALLDMVLVWNVESRRGELPSVRTAPRDTGQIYIYHYVGSHKGREIWILPRALISGAILPVEVDARRKGDEIIIQSAQPFIDDSFLKYSFYQPSLLLNSMFHDWRKAESGADLRLPQSRADFNRLLSAYKTDGFSCKLAEAPGSPLPRYWSSHRWTDLRGQFPVSAAARAVDVEFAGDSLFLADFANRVLEDLEKNCPYFRWRGVTCGSGKQ